MTDSLYKYIYAYKLFIYIVFYFLSSKKSKPPFCLSCSDFFPRGNFRSRFLATLPCSAHLQASTQRLLSPPTPCLRRWWCTYTLSCPSHSPVHHRDHFSTQRLLMAAKWPPVVVWL